MEETISPEPSSLAVTTTAPVIQDLDENDWLRSIRECYEKSQDLQEGATIALQALEVETENLWQLVNTLQPYARAQLRAYAERLDGLLTRFEIFLSSVDYSKQGLEIPPKKNDYLVEAVLGSLTTICICCTEVSRLLRSLLEVYQRMTFDGEQV